MVTGISSNQTKWVLYGDRIDTGSIYFYSVGLSLLFAVCVANTRNVKSKMHDPQQPFKGIEKLVINVETILFYFCFGRREYYVNWNMPPG